VYFLTVAGNSVRMEKLSDGSGTEIRKKNGGMLSVTVHGISVGDLADGLLSELAKRTVIDETGLSGLFEFHLEYSPEMEISTDESAPSLFTALKEQTGLKLTPGRGLAPVFVITRLEKPSGN
ncbi:MAG TPA: TIGR03435 family protein, partial [Bryobacteraceae bacterium]